MYNLNHFGPYIQLLLIPERFNDCKAAWELADASQRKNRAYHFIAHIGPINNFFCVSFELLEKDILNYRVPKQIFSLHELLA